MVTAVQPFSYGGATLIAERRGSGKAVFVLIHGIGMGRRVFDALAERLAQVARVVAIDLPGYGDAPEPERVLTIERMADLVAGFVRAEIGAPVIVVGHSMGAQIGLELAARHPALVDRLALVAPSNDPRARSAFGQFWRLVRDLAVESPRVLVVGGREYLRAGPHLRGKLKALLAHRPENVLDQVTCPTLVIRGEHDIVAPIQWCAEIVDGIADARLVEIAGHGHETMIRDAAPSAEVLIDFARGYSLTPLRTDPPA